ncbi:DUF3311 domain-containing protein [Natrinema altunense]|uniref:DUF3311 domain-containing protein n=1 Tax=Natrinema altunense TaxID=222984 RepID=A0A482Y5N3_9EURY|nr:DUF3311 domain-containing protein [Natrinema altunense]RZH68137.1 DUF3311 domain-containing protein [Natrinema altunense]
MRRNEAGGWIVVGLVLAGLAIPWFLWGSATVVAGLPVWLWWHVGWMGFASLVFWLFTRRAWGIGIEPAGSDGDSSGSREVGPGEAGPGGDAP